MSRRFFDHDPFTGVVQHFHWSDDGKTFTLETTQDITQAVAVLEERRNRVNIRDRWDEGGEHVGYIPIVDLDRMMNDGSIRDPKAIERFFNSNPELKARPWERIT